MILNLNLKLKLKSIRDNVEKTLGVEEEQDMGRKCGHTSASTAEMIKFK